MCNNKVYLIVVLGGDGACVAVKKSSRSGGRFGVRLVLVESGLALLFLDFVAAEVFLSLGEHDVLAQNRVVFAQAEFVGGVHGIFLGVIRTNTGFFRD